MKDKKSVERLLWKNFGVMVLITFLLFVVPYFMVIGLSYYYEHMKCGNIPTASERMQDDYHHIVVQDIVEKNGGVAIVTNDLDVIEIGGKPIFNSMHLSQKEWSEFLQASGKLDVVGYDIAYNEKEGFWLVIQVPVALTIRLEYAANSDSPENKNIFYWVLMIIAVYFLVVTISAIIYAKIISKKLTIPLKGVCRYLKLIEQGDYSKCHIDSKISEIQSLQRGLDHLSDELKKHEAYRDTIENQRKELVMEISHDLKNPLASIQGYTELLLNQQEISEEKKKDYLKMIHTNGIRANELLLSLFYYSQIESKDFKLHVEKQNVCEMIRLVIAEYIPIIEEKGFEIEVEIPEEEFNCMIDTKMMRRVLDNILHNALKYNRSGTIIKVEVGVQGNSVEIRIKDNGRGIPKEASEKIFLPFKRLDEGVRNSKNGGSGLGLAIVKKIIELHQGTVSLQSDTNKGCEFVIHLPKI